jgi:hypothetical protein
VSCRAIEEEEVGYVGATIPFNLCVKDEGTGRNLHDEENK